MVQAAGSTQCSTASHECLMKIVHPPRSGSFNARKHDAGSTRVL